MMKKVISFITALSIIGTMSFATYAYDEPEQPVAPTSSYGVMPLYDNVHYVLSGIDINESNKAICTGSYYLYSTKKSVITMTLMKSTDGVSNWTPVESWSQTSTSRDPAGFVKTSTSALSSSYYYCNYVQVQVYNSRNNVIETVTCFSNTCHL